MDNKSKILVLVEGAKTDVKLMEHLFQVYGISENHEITSYNTNIYTLYNEIKKYYDDPDDIDTLLLLKEHEKNPEVKKIFDQYFSDILLIFDLDPQDCNFSIEKIEYMISVFNESSDRGKLYINFPMVEAFYHMKSIPDENYEDYKVNISDLKKYKTRVNSENRNHDYSKFAVNKNECNIVINQNINKAFNLTSQKRNTGSNPYPKMVDICKAQFNLINNEKFVSVLCTCALYIVDYNPSFIENKENQII